MPEPYGYTIFCDDIREEIGSKVSYMGIYEGSMNVVSDGRVFLPKLAVAMTLIVPGGTAVNTLEFALRREVAGEEEELFKASPVQHLSPAAKDRVMKVGMRFQISPFEVNSDCILKARAILDKKELKIGTLDVKFKNRNDESEEKAPKNEVKE